FQHPHHRHLRLMLRRGAQPAATLARLVYLPLHLHLHRRHRLLLLMIGHDDLHLVGAPEVEGKQLHRFAIVIAGLIRTTAARSSLTGNLTYNPSGSMTVVEKEKKMEHEKKRVLLQCTESIRKLLSKMNEPGITDKQKGKYKMMIKRIKETMDTLDKGHHPAAAAHHTNAKPAAVASASSSTAEAADRKVLLPPRVLQSHNLLPATSESALSQASPATPTAAAK
ncbi:hypothetical protein FOZ62_018869, partial [Perkinsus olseni]